MKRSIIAFLSIFAVALFGLPAKSDIDIGLTLQVGQYETSGSEREKDNAGDNEVTSKTIEETFEGASVYIEAVADNGFTIGIDYVPTDIDLGSGSRTDADGDDAAENDDGTRTASATLEDLITIYTNVPLFGSNAYLLGGIHSGEIITSETLQTSTYPNVNVLGYQVGLGYRLGKLKAQWYYSDYGDYSIDSDQDNGQKINFGAEVTALTLSYGF